MNGYTSFLNESTSIWFKRPNNGIEPPKVKETRGYEYISVIRPVSIYMVEV